MKPVQLAFGRTINPLNPAVPNGYTSERPGPYLSNPPFFYFLTFGLSGAQD